MFLEQWLVIFPWLNTMRLGIATESQPPVIRKKAIWVVFYYPGSVSGSFDRELTGDPGQVYLVEKLLNCEKIVSVHYEGCNEIAFFISCLLTPRGAKYCSQ